MTGPGSIDDPVLVGVDGSEPSDDAVRWAADEAGRLCAVPIRARDGAVIHHGACPVLVVRD